MAQQHEPLLGLGTGDSPQFTSLTLTGNLDVRGEVVNTVSEVITIDDAFVKLNTGNSEVEFWNNS